MGKISAKLPDLMFTANALYHESNYPNALTAYEQLASRPGWARLMKANLALCRLRLGLPPFKLSVIVPVFNTGKYLEQCLTSIQCQTEPSLEIIVINDGSTDNSLDIIQKMMQQDKRIVLINNVKPSGNPGTPRNQGIAIARGEYLGFVDSDDWVETDYFASLLAAIEPDGLDMAFAAGYTNHLHGESKVVTYAGQNFCSADKEVQGYHPSIMIWDKVYRTRQIRSHGIKLGETRAAVDVPFIFKAYCWLKKAGFAPTTGYHYRRESDSSVTVNFRKKSNCDFELQAYKDVETWCHEAKVSRQYQNQVQFRKVSICIDMLATIKPDGFKALFDKVKSELQAIDGKVLANLAKKLDQAPIVDKFKAIITGDAEGYRKACGGRITYAKTNVNVSNHNINVAFICDDNFAMPTYVALYSLIQNSNKDYFYNIYIITQNLSQPCIFQKLESSKISVKIIEFNEKYDGFKIEKKGFHVSTAAVIKFMLPEVLKDIDKVLYLDGDIIVKGDIGELFKIDIKGVYAGVVKDMKPVIKYRPSMLIKLGIEKHDGYFNSGVLLLNLKKMREDNISHKLFNYRKSGVNYFMDQDALNVVFRNNVKYLSIYFNTLVTLFAEFPCNQIREYYRIEDDIKKGHDVIKKSYITHFASNIKPWSFPNRWFDELWNYYFIKSGAGGIFTALCSNEMKKLANVVVSLTSYPKRIETVYLTIKSILKQSFKPSKVVLWLAETQFPKKEKDLPIQLIDLKRYGLEILWCEDIKSYKKLVPSLKKFPNNIIVTADDDVLYNENWLLELLASYVSSPTSIHCHRAHYVTLNKNGDLDSYNNWLRGSKNSEWFSSSRLFFTGVGGVLYPPCSLYKDVLRKEIFMDLCPTGDDIWFWGMALLQGISIKKVNFSDYSLKFIEGTQDVALHHRNDKGGGNDAMLKNILAFYPKLAELFNSTKC